jgi:hypothetical protein
MPNAVSLPARDVALLRLLDRTPATSQHLLKASATFADETFRDERRTRERLQTLAEHGLIRAFPIGQIVGGPVNWYKLTPAGWRYLHGTEAELPHRSGFEAIPAARFEHVRTVADLVVHLAVAAHRNRAEITAFHGDRQLVLETPAGKLIPDCHFQLRRDDRLFNCLFEVDNSTETLSTEQVQSIRSRLSAYESYQNQVWQGWKQAGSVGGPPFFRVVFLTRSVERANNILWLTSQIARNRDRHLIYAGTQDGLLASANPLFEPLLNDHDGGWRCLMPLQPTAGFALTPIRLQPTNIPALRF